MKQTPISSFFKRSATAPADDLLSPAAKKIKSDTHSQPTTPSKQLEPQKTEYIKKDEDDVATPPIPQSPPSPKKVKFYDSEDGGDTEEDELQEQVKSIARRSQSMPETALKAAAIHINNTSALNKDEGEKRQNGVPSAKPTTPKIDHSRSKLVKQQSIGSQLLQIRHGDITGECTGAIVNAANSSLAHGGGVAGAISRKGGSQIQQESDKWVRKNGTVPAGKVAITGSGDLPCSYVIHAVGPVWTNGKHGEDKELYSAVWNSLLKAHQMDLPSISIPAISSGIFGFPKDRCAYIMTECATKFCAKYNSSPLKEIRFTNFDRETVEIFSEEFHNRFDSADSENKENKNSRQTDEPTPSKNATQQIKSNTTSNSPLKSAKIDNNDSGGETEEDESMAHPNGYESSEGEGEDKDKPNNITTNTDSGSDVEWDKWQK